MNTKVRIGLLGVLLLAGLGIGVGVGFLPDDDKTEAIPAPSHGAAIEADNAMPDPTPEIEKKTVEKKAVPPSPKFDKDYSKILNERAEKIFESGDKREAIALFERAIALDPDNESAINNLAVAKGEKKPTSKTKSAEDTEDKTKVKMPDESAKPKMKPGLETPNPEAAKSPKSSPTPTAKPSASPDGTKTAEAKGSENDAAFAAVLVERGTALIKSGNLLEGNKLYEKAGQLDPKNTNATRGMQLVDGITGSTLYRDSGQISQELLAELLVKMGAAEKISGEEMENGKQAQADENDSATKSTEDNNCELELETKTIAKGFYESISLTKEIPRQFRKGEIYTITGAVTGKNESGKVMAFYSPIGGKDTEVFVTDTKKNVFTVPVYFPKEGEYILSICPNTECSAKAERVVVTDPPCEPKTGITHERPSKFVHGIKNGLPNFTWFDQENNLFWLQFAQGDVIHDFYVTDTHEFSPPIAEFIDFKPGKYTVKLSGAYVKNNSFSRESDFIAADKMLESEAVEHVSRDDNHLHNVFLTEEFSLGDEISFSGTSEETLSEEAVIIDPDEKIFTVPLAINKKSFSGSFHAEKQGVYFVEINRKDQLGLFVGGSVSKGLSPILPDYFDLAVPFDDEGESRELAEMSEGMLRFLNRERSERDLRLLTSNQKLQNLAAFRAADMCKRDYFGHIDPDGKGVGDFMEKYEIIGSIGENLAESSGIENGHEALMRSPAHRELIIKPEFTSVGFGFCSDRVEPDTLTIVQIFGTEKE